MVGRKYMKNQTLALFLAVMVVMSIIGFAWFLCAVCFPTYW